MGAYKALSAPVADPPAPALWADLEDDKGGVGACLLPAVQSMLALFCHPPPLLPSASPPCHPPKADLQNERSATWEPTKPCTFHWQFLLRRRTRGRRAKADLPKEWPGTWAPTKPCTPQLQIPLRLPFGADLEDDKGGRGCLPTSCCAVNASPLLPVTTPFAVR